MSKVKDGYWKAIGSKIGNNDYLLKAAGGYIGVGNSSGNIVPLNNSSLNSGLNADMVDGLHASDFVYSLDTSGNYVRWKKYNGNWNSLTVPYASNANKLDNLDSTEFIRIISIDKAIAHNANDYGQSTTFYNSTGDLNSVANYQSIAWDNFPMSRPAGGWWLLNLNQYTNGYRHQITAAYYDPHLYVRTNYASNTVIWSDWKKIAFTTDNVASADYATEAGNSALLSNTSITGLLTNVTLRADTNDANKTVSSVTVGGTTLTSSFTIPYSTRSSYLDIITSSTAGYIDDAKSGKFQFNVYGFSGSAHVSPGGNTPSTGDGFAMVFNWGNSYVAQIAVDLDPTYKMAIRHWRSDIGWKTWKNILTGNNTYVSNGYGVIDDVSITKVGYADNSGNADTLDTYHESSFFRKGRNYAYFTTTVAYNQWNRIGYVTANDAGVGSTFIVNVGAHYSSTVTNCTFLCTATYSGNLSITELSNKNYKSIKIRITASNNYPTNCYIDLNSPHSYAESGTTYRVSIIIIEGASFTEEFSANVSALSYVSDELESNADGRITTRNLLIKNTSRENPVTIIGKDYYSVICLQGSKSNDNTFRYFGIHGSNADLFITNKNGWSNEYKIFHEGNYTTWVYSKTQSDNKYWYDNGNLYQNNSYNANTLKVGGYIFRSSSYGGTGQGSAHANALNENSTIEVFANLQLSTVAWSDTINYRVRWGAETSTARPNAWSAWNTLLSNTNYTDYVYGKSTSDSRYLRKDTNDSTPYQYSFTKTDNHAIQVGTIRGRAVGSRTGEYIHLYERVHIGSPNGWGSNDAPSYGLSTYGGAWLATNTGSVGIGTTSPSEKLHVNGGIIRIDSNNKYLTIGCKNVGFAHYITNSGDGHYFNHSIHADGDIYIYSTQYGIRRTGDVYGEGFYKSGSSNNYVLLGAGGHKLESSLSVSNADTVDGYHASTLFETFENYNSGTTWGIKAKIGNNEKTLTPTWLGSNTNITFGATGLQYWNNSLSTRGTPTTNGTPTNDWYHIIRMNHGNSAGYYVDIATCFHSWNMWYRRVQNGIDQGWVRILDSNNTYVNSNGYGYINNTLISKVSNADYATDSTYIKFTFNSTANYSDSAKGKSNTFSIYGLSGSAHTTEYGNGPSTGDGYFAVFNWSDAYVTQIAIDLDPTNKLSIRNWKNDSTGWRAWVNILTGANSYVNSNGYGYINSALITKVGTSDNADKLNNLDSTEFIRIKTINVAVAKNANDYSQANTLYRSSGDLNSVSNYTSIAWDNFPVGRPGGGWALLNIAEGGYLRQIAGFYSDDHLYVRSQSWNANGHWTNRNWKKIAFTTDNVASADYATSAGSVAWGNITGKPFNWSGQSGQPTWLWGSNDGANYYVWNPSNFNVNYANSAGYTNYLSLTTAAEDSCIPSSNNRFGVYYANTCSADGSDGYIMTLGTGGYWSQFYIDVDKTYKMALRQRTASAGWNDWVNILTSNNSYVDGNGNGIINGSTVTNVDKIDGYHASGLFETFSTYKSGTTYGLKAKIGGAEKTLTPNFLGKNTDITFGASGLQYFNDSLSTRGSASSNGTPKNDWYHIIRMNHANSAGYYVDMALCFHSWDFWYRRVANGSDQGWIRVLDSNNSSVSKSGETLTVKINDTSYSLTNTNDNTWRPITNTYTGSDQSTSVSQYGTNALYNALVNGYANSAGSADSATNASLAHKLDIYGYVSSGLSFYQTNGTFDGNSDWCHYIIANHGNGETYYHYTIGLPFWGPPIYKRQTGNTSSTSGWYTFLSTENYTSYTVTKTGSGASGTWGINITGSAGSVAWGNITDKPSNLGGDDYIWKSQSGTSYKLVVGSTGSDSSTIYILT